MTFFFRLLTFRLSRPPYKLLFDQALADAAAMKLGEPVANESTADVDPGRVETERYCDGTFWICSLRWRYTILSKSVFILNTLTYLRHLHMPHRCRLSWNSDFLQDIQCKFGECTTICQSASIFRRHYKTHLPASQSPKLDCTFEGCDRVGQEGFSRKDNLIQHLRRVHHQDIPKTWRRRENRTRGVAEKGEQHPKGGEQNGQV